jgi:hypothetical protein
MDENPYRAPQEKPLAYPPPSGLRRRYESVGQRLISLALLLFVFVFLFVPTTLMSVYSAVGDMGKSLIYYALLVGAVAWIGAVVWLICRMIRRSANR